MNAQLALFTAIPTDKKERAKRNRQQVKESRTVRETLAQMHTLREQLNELLYKAEERPAINSPADAAMLFQPQLEALENEELHIMLLDRRNKVLQIVRVYSGSTSSAQVRVGELFREAIRQNASALIVAHNHPSGDPTPSPDDVAVTRAIVQAGKLLDIDVLDHVVIGRGRWVSLKERGLGFS
jgi:DNA repair protein RadC